MTTAPARDLMFSQRTLPPREVRAFFFPRACETTLAAMDDEGKKVMTVEHLPAAPTRARVPSRGKRPRGRADDRHAPSLRTREAFVLLQVLVHQLRHLE